MSGAWHADVRCLVPGRAVRGTGMSGRTGEEPAGHPFAPQEPEVAMPLVAVGAVIVPPAVIPAIHAIRGDGKAEW